MKEKASPLDDDATRLPAAGTAPLTPAGDRDITQMSTDDIAKLLRQLQAQQEILSNPVDES